MQHGKIYILIMNISGLVLPGGLSLHTAFANVYIKSVLLFNCNTNRVFSMLVSIVL